MLRARFALPLVLCAVAAPGLTPSAARGQERGESGYQDARFLGFERVTNGSVCDPVLGSCVDRGVKAYIIESAGFRYLVASPSDNQAPLLFPSPFAKHPGDFFGTAQPGMHVGIRVAGQDMFVADDRAGKERHFSILSVGPAGR